MRSAFESVPLQFTLDTGGGLEATRSLNLDLPPVFPFRLSDAWKVIARTIVPINSYPASDGLHFR